MTKRRMDDGLRTVGAVRKSVQGVPAGVPITALCASAVRVVGLEARVAYVESVLSWLHRHLHPRRRVHG